MLAPTRQDRSEVVVLQSMCRNLQFIAPKTLRPDPLQNERSFRKLSVYKGLRQDRAAYSCLVPLAEQVLLSDTRKEAALDLHSPISTSHNKSIRQADWPLASPFLTFLPFASFELWPQKWGRFFLS